jgi:hypothetical protein
MHRETIVLHIASQQGGIIRRDQALDAGFTKSTIDRRVSRGEWQVIGHGGYRLFSVPGRLGLVRAAVAVLPAAIVSHYSAAAIHGMPRVPTDTASVSVHSRTTHTFPGVRVFRYDDLESAHVTRLKELPITTVERTVIDLAALLTGHHAASIVDELLADGRCTVEGLRSVLDAVARRGKPGVRAMRAVLDERSIGFVDGTPLERRGTALLVESGLSDFCREYPIPWAPHRRFDVAFPQRRLAIEWDSRRWHTQVDAFRRDRERDRQAVEHGWRILRFTWQDVHETPNAVIESVRTVLAA